MEKNLTFAEKLIVKMKAHLKECKQKVEYQKEYTRTRKEMRKKYRNNNKIYRAIRRIFKGTGLGIKGIFYGFFWLSCIFWGILMITAICIIPLMLIF